MKKLFTRILVLCFAGIIAVSSAGAAVKEKTFWKYETDLPVLLQNNINSPKKVGKIVEDVIYHGDIDQLYWLVQIWIGLDINSIDDKAIYDYFFWEQHTLAQLFYKDSILVPIRNGRKFYGTFYSSFYPHSDTRTKMIQMGCMLSDIYSYHIAYTNLQTIAEHYRESMLNVVEEEKSIRVHYIERMLYGDDSYSCAYRSPAPSEEITGPIAKLLGKEVLKDPTTLIERISNLPAKKDSTLIAIMRPLMYYEAYYISSYDQEIIRQRLQLVASRIGIEEEDFVNRIVTVASEIYPNQMEIQWENMMEMKNNSSSSTDLYYDFVSFYDSLRHNGYSYVEMPLTEIPLEQQGDEIWMRYLEKYLRVGYALCKEISQINAYHYLNNNTEALRNVLRALGYYHPMIPKEKPLISRFIYYLCDLLETTQSWYYGTNEAWAIGAVMVEHDLLITLLNQYTDIRMYETLSHCISFCYHVLNNKALAKSHLDNYIYPLLDTYDLKGRYKDDNCFLMWFYAMSLRYTYLLYEGDESEQLGKKYAGRLIDGVNYNKKCDHNAYAISELIQFCFMNNNVEVAQELMEEYMKISGDSTTYYGFQFLLDFHHLHNYASAAAAADIVNRNNVEELAGWYTEYSLGPSEAYALAGWNEKAQEQLEIFDIFMRNVIGKQLMGMGSTDASRMLERYMDINNRFIMISRDTIAQNMKDKFMCSFYDWQLQSKGLLLALNSERDSLLASHPDTKIRDLYHRFKQREKDLANLSAQNSWEGQVTQYNYFKAQSVLQTAIQEYIDKNGFEGVNQANWTDVRDALKDGQVAIEIVNGKIGEDSIPVYYALLLRRDAEAPVAIRLFSEEEVSSLTSTRGKENIHNIYSYDAKGQKLTQTIWGAILPHIKQGEVVFFSPSGILHQIAMENLPYDETSTIGDKYNLVRLSSTREIIGGKRADSHQNAALFGDIRYNATPTDLAVEHQKYESQHSSTDLAMANIQRMTLRDMAYDLPGTKIEVDSIEFMLKQKHVQVNTYRGRSATEESFKALSGQGKNILHLATHGFYWPEKEAQQQKFFTQNSTIESDVQQALPIDPLNRCGLLFAGANTALGGHSNRLDKGVQDGILTAKEISALDLRGADIVVLSACETGLGDVSGEGVFGLQRAFKIAGAQTMLMALWKVDDDATRMLTTAFYRHYSQGMSKRQAFRMAQQEVRSYTAEGTVSENNGRSVLHEKYKNKGKMTGQAPQPPKGGGSVTGDGLRVTEEAPQPPKGGAESSEVSKQAAEVSKEGGEVSHPYASPYYWAGFILLD